MAGGVDLTPHNGLDTCICQLNVQTTLLPYVIGCTSCNVTTWLKV